MTSSPLKKGHFSLSYFLMSWTMAVRSSFGHAYVLQMSGADCRWRWAGCRATNSGQIIREDLEATLKTNMQRDWGLADTENIKGRIQPVTSDLGEVMDDSHCAITATLVYSVSPRPISSSHGPREMIRWKLLLSLSDVESLWGFFFSFLGIDFRSLVLITKFQDFYGSFFSPDFLEKYVKNPRNS